MRRFLYAFLVITLVSGVSYVQLRPSSKVQLHPNHPPVASISDAFTHF